MGTPPSRSQATKPPIPIPWDTRLRLWLTQRLQACLFFGSVIALGVIWYRQAPRIVLTGKVDALRVTVPASQDGVLQFASDSLNRFDRVETGLTTICRFDLSDAVLTMESLTEERRRLQAELEAERQRIRQQTLQWRWEATQNASRREQLAIDRDRIKQSRLQRLDGLRDTVEQLEQDQRQWQVSQQENMLELERVRLQLQGLNQDRLRTVELIEQRVASASQLEQLDWKLQVQRKAQGNLSRLAETFSEQGVLLANALAEAKTRLSLIDPPTQELATADDRAMDADAISPPRVNEEALLEPFVRAIAVQDAKIRRLAHQISNNEVVAPESGQIVEVHQRPGTFVSKGDPIVTIASSDQRWIIAYLDRANPSLLSSDSRVEVQTENGSQAANASIVDIGFQYEQVPTELRRRRDVSQRGIPIKIAVPDSLSVLPGQLVRLVIE
ncbi:MAG: HlyD family efflux transporter periplasmic adaptor subunit [Planctomycetota bacterium]